MSRNILRAQVKLLYDQIPVALFGECLAVTSICVALWTVFDQRVLIGWLLYMFIASATWRGYIVWRYRHHYEARSQKAWLTLFVIGVLISSLGWGFAAGVFIPVDSVFQQNFVVIVLLGITASASSYYSPIRSVYIAFLLPAVLPYAFWLFAQGGDNILLGYCVFLYIFVMLGSSHYLNSLVVSSLELRLTNIDLGFNNQLLEKKVAERTNALEKSFDILRASLESSEFGVLVVDNHGHIEYFNQTFLDMWEIPQDVITGYTYQDISQHILSKLENPDSYARKMQHLHEQSAHEWIDELTCKDGKFFELYVKPHGADKGKAGHIWQYRDISERKQMEHQLAYQANHDLLTSLPNRTLLYDRIEQGIVYAQRFQNHLTLLFLDVDNFKIINDSLGHNAGDQLLQEVAARLKECVRKSDTVSRFGGDEFVILFMNSRREDITVLADHILNKVTQPIKLSGHDIVVTTSIGISTYPHHGKDATTLLKNADMAMYFAKRQGRNNYQLYDEEINYQSQKKLEIQSQIRNAIKNKEFFMLYQPIIHIETGEICAVEALMRWQHPDFGLLLPNDFIIAAEECGLIVPLGEWGIRTACLQNAAWQKMGLPPIRIAVNVSGVQVKREGFIDTLEDILKQSRMDPGYLEIELTESTLMDNTKKIISLLLKLDSIGIDFVIDDFGTGYSSLNYLKKFPVNKLKIDQCFVRDCTKDSNDASIVEAIIAMGHGLKLKVIAEGVENKEQLQLLKDLGCDQGQGYYFAEPLTADDFADLLRQNTLRAIASR
ncbi:putative bifunctional diguanylate cyclase/phosphodiesterase [Legionella taurinensis]|uniref:putative bifunctional diguanylate cyclase/phosphodiesterase n=1 Tax=Legionella taurinensis TaxID=70611 RepID=UPI001F5E89D8|nr:EAL domain-containing protein [Legionella taurinensis]MDX1837569.1 EAL domain-containing protein [Legionella taurinensis]